MKKTRLYIFLAMALALAACDKRERSGDTSKPKPSLTTTGNDGLPTTLELKHGGIENPVFSVRETMTAANPTDAEQENARNLAKSLRNSVRALLLNLPSSALSPDLRSVDFTRSTDQAFMDVIRGKDLERNPRGMEFGEWHDGALVDSWGNPYRVTIDGDGDGALPDPVDENNTLKQTIFVYSAGFDGDFTTWDDNIISSR